MYAHAETVVAKSDWAAASVRDDYGVDARKVRTLAFGIVPGPRPRPRPPRRPTIVFVGRSLERKGGKRLLDIWRRRLHDRCDLVLVTKDRVRPADGLRVVTDIDVGDERLTTILDEATVFGFPSTMDASPHVVFEAMARALPVVVCRAGGMPEQVIDGQTGYVTDPDDDDGLATALEALVADPARARRMGDAGHALVEERFDMTRQIRPFLEILYAAAGRPSATSRRSATGS